MPSTSTTTPRTHNEARVHYGIVDARAIRHIAKKAGLAHLIERVTASRSRTYVRLVWAEVRDDTYATKADQLAKAIQAAFAAEGREAKVMVTWKGSLTAERHAFPVGYRTN